jgi:hypothetical protein
MDRKKQHKQAEVERQLLLVMAEKERLEGRTPRGDHVGSGTLITSASGLAATPGVVSPRAMTDIEAREAAPACAVDEDVRSALRAERGRRRRYVRTCARALMMR